MNKPAAPQWFRDAVASPFLNRTVAVAGCHIHYLTWGDWRKPQLMLVHGGAAHAMWWSFLAPLLSQHYFVVAPDLSGHGDSGHRTSYSLTTWADELLAVSADAGGGLPPVIVGHSMGGLVSIVTAAGHGDRLAGVVLVDSGVKRPDPESEEAAAGRSWRSERIYGDREEALAHFRLLPAQPCENDFVLRHIAHHSVKRTDAGWTWKFDSRLFTGLARHRLSEYLARVHCRVAMLRGELSAVVPLETGHYMYEVLNRNAPLVEIPQAHHHLMLDQPLAFIAALRALLADWEHSTSRAR